MDIWLAPLHGITNYTFRNGLFRHFGGIDRFITPFMPVQETEKLNVKSWRDIYPENNTAAPAIPQLMGNRPSHFADTMHALHDRYGYEDFNWNIGCPVAQVVRRRRGCGLMPDADAVEAVVSAVTSQTPYRFSVKMRLGLINKTEGLEILRRMEHYPLSFIVIHPRLGKQMYDGEPDLEAMDLFCRNTSHKVIYSGDIFTKERLAEMQRRYPTVNNWMLGRGLLRNPFLAEEIKGMETGNKQRRFLRYYQLSADESLHRLKERSTLAHLKELWHYYAALVNLSADELQQLLRINDFSHFYDKTLRILQEWTPTEQ